MRFVRGHATRLSAIEYREEDRGHSTPCWIWQKSINPVTGYGYEAKSRKSAHRYMYEKHCGPIAPGLELDHLCGVHECCRPSHLEEVTHSENAKRGNTGRSPKKDARKLIDDHVREIRRSKLSNRKLASIFNTNRTTVAKIKRREWYKEVSD
jgi:hypothetical protein